MICQITSAAQQSYAVFVDDDGKPFFRVVHCWGFMQGEADGKAAQAATGFVSGVSTDPERKVRVCDGFGNLNGCCVFLNLVGYSDSPDPHPWIEACAKKHKQVIESEAKESNCAIYVPKGKQIQALTGNEVLN